MILFGALFAIFASNDRAKPFYDESAFWHGLVFTSLFNVAVVYAIIKFPDWMWMYFVDNSTNSFGELLYLFVFVYYLPYLLGFYLGKDLITQSKLHWILCLILLVASEGWIVWHLFDRYSVIGSLEQFQNSTAVSLFSPDNPIGPVMNGSVGLMVVYFLFVCYLHRRRKV